MRVIPLLALCLFACTGPIGICGYAQGRRFSVKDDVEMSNIDTFPRFSPNGKHFFVETSRSPLDKSGPESSIWMWNTDEVVRYAQIPGSPLPKPTELVRLATYDQGPLITSISWLDDSSGVSFVGVTSIGTHQVFQVKLADHKLEALTPANQNVNAYSLRAGNLVYTVRELMHPAASNTERVGSALKAIDITGTPLWHVLFPTLNQDEGAYSEIWAVVRGKRFQIVDTQTRVPVHIDIVGGLSPYGAPFDISPDGRTLLTINVVTNVPAEWDRYKSPTGYNNLRQFWTFASRQSVEPKDSPFDAFHKISSYQLLDLRSGKFSVLLNAPNGYLFDWNSSLQTPRWASNGKDAILPSSFLPLDNTGMDNEKKDLLQACVVAVNVVTRKGHCLLPVVAGLDKERNGLLDARFDAQNDNRIVIEFNPWAFRPPDKDRQVFDRGVDGRWEQGPENAAFPNRFIDIKMQESLDDPPGLAVVDRNKGTRRMFWNANPQLTNVALGKTSIITWTDKTGYEWRAALIKPPDFIEGKQYPLIIQTHGFNEHTFLSHGATTTSFAARELAGSGMLVVQMGWNATHFGTPQEAADQVQGFASLVATLDRERLILPNKVGLLGWSRSVYHMYATLVAHEPRIAAASAIEGVNYGYWQYLASVGSGVSYSTEIGTEPFGAGLKTWLEKAPLFNLDKVETPLLMLETGPSMLLADWEPYAALYSLHKPVDVVLIPSGGHIETNPQQRMITQGMTVDWFRFWLQGYEDSDPTKRDQYKRWEHLRELQEAEDKAGGQSATAAPEP